MTIQKIRKDCITVPTTTILQNMEFRWPFFFDGIHEDYHQPTDDAEKIDYNSLQKRTQMIFATAWELANRKDRIMVDVK